MTVRCNTLQAGIGMADLSLIPKAAWHEAKCRAEMPGYERGRPALPSAEADFDILLKSTLKNDTDCQFQV